jgi:hypothetical protein
LNAILLRDVTRRFRGISDLATRKVAAFHKK